MSQRSQAEYEALFFQLLEKVAQGGNRGQVQAFLMTRSLQAGELTEWLSGFGGLLLNKSYVSLYFYELALIISL
jgi:hypothetical protein